ncbi:MAG: hypothetical protein AABY16_03475 [Nanoarchaeota archaeon]
MRLIGYLTNLRKKLFPPIRYRLENELESVTVRLNDALREAEESAKLWSAEAFEHDMVFTRREIVEAENFAVKLNANGLHRDANRLNSKIREVKDYCDKIKQRYED